MAHLDPETLSAYIDQELSPDQRDQVKEHLASCAECRQEYEELRALSTLVRQLPVYTPKRVIEIDETPMAKPTMLNTMIEFSRPLALAAIIILVAFAGLRLVTDSDDGDDISDEGQISFSEVQEETLGDGTELPSDASVRVAEDREAASDAQQPLEAAAPEESVSQMVEEAVEFDSEQEEPGPAAAMQLAPTATVEPTVEPEPGNEEDSGNSWLRLTASIILAALVIGGGTWLLLYRTPRRS